MIERGQAVESDGSIVQACRTVDVVGRISLYIATVLLESLQAANAG